MFEPRLISKSLLRNNYSIIDSPKKPDWIKIKIPNKLIKETKNIIIAGNLTTVCEEALCPNLGTCWSKKHATFMILGDVCTRSCSFCNIQTGKPKLIDESEPMKVAIAVKKLKLNHVVITSVDRDDLIDGGALHFYNTVKEIKKLSPNVTIEILTPDFKKKNDYLKIIKRCKINVFNHNMETVKKLYKSVRPGADYSQSLLILKKIKQNRSDLFTKSGIMIGLGEKLSDIKELLHDLRRANVDFLTIGQYLRPSKDHFPVLEYHSINYFDYLKHIAINMGFKSVTSFPFARSSYKSEDEYKYLESSRYLNNA